MTTEEITQAGAPDPWTLGVPPFSALPQSFLDLSGAQSPQGCPPLATRRAVDAVSNTDGAWRAALGALRSALSRKFSIPEDRICLGAGCRTLLPALLRCVCEPGDVVAVSAPPPPLHRLACAQASAQLREVLLRGLHHDLDAWVDILRGERPRVALLGHPLNPSGSFLSRQDFRLLLAAVDTNKTLVVIDEAYADYADKPEFPRLAPILDDTPNLLILRSFSSLYGLAGLPAAYCLCTAKTAARLAPFLVGQEPGTVAARAATGAAEEPSFEPFVADLTGRSRFKLLQTLREWQVRCEGGVTPWTMIAVGDSADAARRLAARGLRVRDLAPWGFDGWLRVRAGNDEEVARFLADARPVLAPR